MILKDGGEGVGQNLSKISFPNDGGSLFFTSPK